MYDSAFLGSCEDPELRAACAIPAPLTAGPGQTLQTGDVVLGDGRKVGTVSLRLTPRETDALVEVDASPLALPAGSYTLKTCIVLLQDAQAPWTSCRESVAERDPFRPLPSTTTVGRPYGADSTVSAYVTVERRGTAAPEVVASNLSVGAPVSLPVPARAA